jgi:ribosomal protein S10
VPRASAVYRGAKNCPSKIYESPSFDSRSINSFELRTYNRKFELIKEVPLIFK